MRSTQLINDYSLVMQRHKADMCRFGDYDLHDLIELDQQTVGVMIQADAETCQVLTNRNAVSHHPVPAKLDSKLRFSFRRLLLVSILSGFVCVLLDPYDST